MPEEQRRLLAQTLANNIEDMLDGMKGVDEADIEHVTDLTLKAFNKALDQVEDFEHKLMDAVRAALKVFDLDENRNPDTAEMLNSAMRPIFAPFAEEEGG